MKNEERTMKNGRQMKNEGGAKKGQGVTAFSFLIFTFSFLICLSCGNVLDTPQDAVAPEAGYGRVAVTLTGASGRTVFPAVAFAKYEYNFIKMIDGLPAMIDGLPVFEPKVPVNGFFTLEPGDWIVAVYAYAGADDTDHATSGSSSLFTVIADAIVPVTVQLSGSVGGGRAGTFSYHIEYPEGAEITVFSLANLLSTQAAPIDLTPASGEADEGDPSVIILSGTYDGNVPAGCYYLTIRLGLDGAATGANEVVYIYDKLDSVYRMAFAAEDFSNTVVNTAAIPGVTAPAVLAMPVTAITETEQYAGAVAWSPALNTDGSFKAGTAYTATITLAAKEGWTLNGVAANFFTVAGADSATNAAHSGVVTAVFPATPAAVTILAVPGVTPPVTLETPVTDVTETAQYTGTAAWLPDDFNADGSFKAGTAYTATVTLAAKQGWTLGGVAANSFTVAGATSVTNAANSGVVTAVFPAPQPLPFTGTVEITDGDGITVTLRTAGTELTAAYDGPVLNEYLTYQWYKDDEPVAAGGDSATYTPASTGTYTVTVGNADPNYAGAAITGGNSVYVADYIIRNAADWTSTKAAIKGSTVARTLTVYFDNASAADASPAEPGRYDPNTFGTRPHTITFKGNGWLSLGTTGVPGCLILLADGQTLTIDGDVDADGNDLLVLQGKANEYPLIRVTGTNTKLILNHGRIYRNYNRSTGGGDGGGVYVLSGASFTMNGGKIHENEAGQLGAGVTGDGGGVYTNGSATRFIMNGGVICDNIASGSGGGVGGSVTSFTMNSGTISGNSATGSNGGGGVSVSSSYNFTMNGGTISGNGSTTKESTQVTYRTNWGGGVAVIASGNFTMTGGTISGNSAHSNANTYGGGGGVLVSGTSAVFNKTGGIIYGNDAPLAADRNTAALDNLGHTVRHYIGSSESYYLNETLDENDNISAADTKPAASGETEGYWTRR
jgi:hypothetical protein